MMTIGVVRDEGIEKELLALLQKDQKELWNVSKLKEALGCSRGKIEKAVAALSGQGNIQTDYLGTSWVVRLTTSSGNEGEGL